MRNTFLLLLFLIFISAKGQTDSLVESKSKDSVSINPTLFSNYKMGKGLVLISKLDSTFQLKVRARMQNRVTYYDTEGEKGSVDPQIRRLRLRI